MCLPLNSEGLALPCCSIPRGTPFQGRLGLSWQKRFCVLAAGFWGPEARRDPLDVLQVPWAPSLPPSQMPRTEAFRRQFH